MICRTTHNKITELKPNQIFVFGSNIEGRHMSGAANLAHNYFGAVWGIGAGINGDSYAIPTMYDTVLSIKSWVDDFVKYAKGNTSKVFLVTEIGCGIAGFTAAEIAPLFEDCKYLENVHLPLAFWNELNK